MQDRDKILVHGLGGKLIKAMTPNQQKLVDFVHKNDMVFAVGPAGTGKTYAMLSDAHDAQKEGIDVVVGYIEPHARPDTMALLTGLEVLPPLEVAYHGVTLKEFDLDKSTLERVCFLICNHHTYTKIDDIDFQSLDKNNPITLQIMSNSIYCENFILIDWIKRNFNIVYFGE
jgi:hypothetical protein